MKSLNIGRLNKRIQFMTLENVEDEFGQSAKRLIEFCTVWGTLTPVRGSEYYEVRKIESKVTHKCYVRYMPGINPNMYLMCGGKTYTITSVIDVELSHWMLEIMCVEHGNKEAVPYGG